MSSKEQSFREALARIASGFYTEKGAENHAKDIIRLVDSQVEPPPLTSKDETLDAWLKGCEEHIESGIATDLVAICPVALRRFIYELRERRAAETRDERGHVTVVTNEAGECVAVTRTGEDHEILSVIWERSARSLAERHPNSTRTDAGSNPAVRANSAPSAAGRVATEASFTREASGPATVGADSPSKTRAEPAKCLVADCPEPTADGQAMCAEHMKRIEP